MKKILMLLAINSLFVTTYSNVVSCLSRSKFKKTDLPDSETAGNYTLIVNDETIKEQMTQYLIDYYNSNSSSTKIKNLGNGIDISATNNTGADATNSKPLKGIEYTIKIKVEFSNLYYNAGNITVDRAPLEKINIPNDTDYTYSLKEDGSSIKTQIMSELLDYYKTKTSNEISSLGSGITITATNSSGGGNASDIPVDSTTYNIIIKVTTNDYYNPTDGVNLSITAHNENNGDIISKIENAPSEISIKGFNLVGDANDPKAKTEILDVIGLTHDEQNKILSLKGTLSLTDPQKVTFYVKGESSTPEKSVKLVGQNDSLKGLSINNTCIATIKGKTVFYASVDGAGLFESTDGGEHYTNTGKINRICLCIFQAKSGNIYIGTDKGLYESSDDGGTFAPIAASSIGYSIVLYIFQAKSGTIYVGTSKHGVFMSTDSEGIFSKTEISGGSYSMVQADNGDILAGTDKGLYKSTDGKTFSSGGIQDKYVGTMAKAQDGTIYAGTDKGLYKSTDDGSTFNNITVSGINAGEEIYKFYIFNNVYYLGTDKGLYTSSNGKDYTAIENDYSVIDIKELNNILYISSNDISGLWYYSA